MDGWMDGWMDDEGGICFSFLLLLAWLDEFFPSFFFVVVFFFLLFCLVFRAALIWVR